MLMKGQVGGKPSARRSCLIQARCGSGGDLAAGGWRVAAWPACTKPITTKSSPSWTRALPPVRTRRTTAGRFFPILPIDRILPKRTILPAVESRHGTVIGGPPSRRRRTDVLLRPRYRKSGAGPQPRHENRDLERQRPSCPPSSTGRVDRCRAPGRRLSAGDQGGVRSDTGGALRHRRLLVLLARRQRLLGRCPAREQDEGTGTPRVCPSGLRLREPHRHRRPS